MGVLSDKQIRMRLRVPGSATRSDETRLLGDRPDGPTLVIHPFAEHTKEAGRPSHGLSSMGYDLRLGRAFKAIDYDKLMRAGFISVSPRQPIPKECYACWEADSVTIPPRGFVLGATLEQVRVPRDCLALMLGKSTLARLGIDLNTTPLEPGWRGHVTIEITNQLSFPVTLFAGDGVGQMVLIRCEQGGWLTKDCEVGTSYDERANPTYQDQPAEPVPAK